MKLRQIFIETKGSQEGKVWLERTADPTYSDQIDSIVGDDETGYTIKMKAGAFVLNTPLGTDVEIPYKINKVEGSFSVSGNLSSLKNLPNEVTGQFNLSRPIDSISNYPIKCKRFTCLGQNITTLDNCLIETEEGIILKDPRRINISPSTKGTIFLGGTKNKIEVTGDLTNTNLSKLVFFGSELDLTLIEADIVNLICFRPGVINITQQTAYKAPSAVAGKKEGVFESFNAELNRSLHRYEGKGADGAFDLVDDLYNQGFKNFL